MRNKMIQKSILAAILTFSAVNITNAAEAPAYYNKAYGDIKVGLMQALCSTNTADGQRTCNSFILDSLDKIVPTGCSDMPTSIMLNVFKNQILELRGNVLETGIVDYMTYVVKNTCSAPTLRNLY